MARPAGTSPKRLSREAVGHVGWRTARRQAAAPRPRRFGPHLPAPDRRARFICLVFVLLYAAVFAYLSVLQHLSFNTNAFDLGNFFQAVWNTAHGRPFEFTNWSGANTRLAAHFEPILLPVAVVARFWPDPAALLVLQTVVVASGALSAFGFAYRRLGSELAALTFAAAYLLAPELDAAVLAEFHPVAMASAFLMHALYFYSAGQKGPFLLFAFLAASTKEQVPLAVGLLGLRAAVRPGWRQLGLRVAAAGILWFGLATFVVIPLHNPAGASPYLSRYDHLGGSPVEIIKTILGRPEVLLQEAQNPVKAAYLLTLFRPVVFLPFLAPVTLLPALPDLLLNLLSTFEPMFRGGAHYSAVIVPFVIGAAVDGLDVLRRLAARVRPDLGPRVVGGCSALVLISAAHAYVADVLLPLYDRLPVVTPHDRLAPEVLKVIPEDAPVSAGNSLNPHLAARRRLYLFPEVRDAEYVAVDVTASPYPVDAGTQYWQLQALLNGGEWGVAAARDGYLVLVRGSRVRELPEEFFTFALAGPDEKYEPVGAVFAPGLRLVGYRLEPGTVLRGRDPVARLVTFWQAEGPIREDVRLVFRLVGPDGRVLEDRPYQAATLWLPPSRWPVGSLIKVEDRFGLREGPVRVQVWVGRQAEFGRPIDPYPLMAPPAGDRFPVSDGRAVNLATLYRG